MAIEQKECLTGDLFTFEKSVTNILRGQVKKLKASSNVVVQNFALSGKIIGQTSLVNVWT